METANIKLTEIQKELSLLPENKLDEVKYYIESLLDSLKIEMPRPVNLSGIWKDTGFENIEDLDKEIQNLRKEMSDSISRKII